MRKRVAHIVVSLIFATLLGGLVVHRYLTIWETREMLSIAPEEARTRYGFVFEEVAHEAGIRFTHEAPVLDDDLVHIMPQVASMGATVSVVDYDRDGWQDLYLTNSRLGSHNALYRNLGDGTFADVAPLLGLAGVNRPGTGVSMGAVWGDYDNDGYEDLFLYKWGRCELFRNEAGAGFTRITDGAGLPSWANVNAGIWLDYDRDGHLDLFFGGYYPEHYDLWNLSHTRIMPESFEYARNGGRKYLLRGHGDGTFSDVTTAAGLHGRRWMMAAGAADLRGTGYPDLFIANDYGIDEIFFNEGGRFRAVSEETRIGTVPKSGMNVAFGDVMNQGALSVYVTNISEPGVLVQGNSLWMPVPGSEDDDLRFENMANTLQVELGGWSYGAQFGDFNNDGLLDLFATNGYVSTENRHSYWYDFSKVAGGNRAIISDAKNWPAMEGRSLSGHQRKHLWLNTGAWRFDDVAAAVGVNETFDGRSVVLADLWNRGALDVVVAHQRGPLLVYRNHVAPEHGWIGFALEGRTSNRSAIGAQVEVFWNGQRQLQQVSGGSGFCAQNDRRLHFGLGANAHLEAVVVHWPSGQQQTFTGLALGQVHTLVEPS